MSENNIQVPLVSVLVPVFNAEKYLRAALDSILKQSYTDFELILVDDGSTDSSSKIIASYNDPRIRYYYQENQGVASALNMGLSLARGKYIWRHDADDISSPSKLERQLDFLEHHPEFALCATQIAFMTARGKVAMKYRQPRVPFFEGKEFIEVDVSQFNPYSPITHATVLMRTEVMKEVGGYRTEFRTAEDIDLWLRVIQSHRIAVLNQCNYFVRLSESSTTYRLGSKKNDYFRNLAMKYYWQRDENGQDDLELGAMILQQDSALPSNIESTARKGRLVRKDLLDYLYYVEIDAKDYKGVARIVALSIRDGWKVSETWRLLLIPLMPEQCIKAIVSVKKYFRRKLGR